MEGHHTVVLVAIECSGVIWAMQIDDSLANVQCEVRLLGHVNNSSLVNEASKYTPETM